MSRLLIAIYGVIAYVVGLVGLLLFIVYVGDWPYSPLRINGQQPVSVITAICVNLSLMAVFAVQHSGMARPAFKQVWEKIIPPAAERSTYVLFSGIVMVLFCAAWQPLPGTLWHVEQNVVRVALTTVQLAGWAVSIFATFSINHWELLGLQQVYNNWIGKVEPSPEFSERGFYRHVRHPIQMGVLVGIWSAPTMTMTHLMLSALMTLYVLLGLYFEEQDLTATLGEAYRDYRRRVPMLVPLPFWLRKPRS